MGLNFSVGVTGSNLFPWLSSVGACSHRGSCLGPTPLVAAPSYLLLWRSLGSPGFSRVCCIGPVLIGVPDTGLVTCRLLALACCDGGCSVFGPSLEQVNGSGLFLWKSLAQISPEEICGLGQIPGSSLAWTCSLDS